MSVWGWSKQRLAALPPRAILLIGYFLFLVWAFPGYMSTDSEVQLMEARSGVFSNAHPPFMAAEWRLLDAFVSGPLLMLLLQGALFLGGLYKLLCKFAPRRMSAWVAIAILLFPPVLTTMAVIWKDSQMAAYAVAGVAAILSPRLRTRIIGLGLLVLAASLRHNAPAAVAPLVFFMFEWRGGMRWWKRIAIGFAAVVVTVVAMFGLSKVLTSTAVKMTPAFQDVVGVIAWMDDTSDADLRERLRGVPLHVETGIQDRARRLFYIGGAFRITQGDEPFMYYPRNNAEWDALQRAWIDLILDQPDAYLSMHRYGFEKILGLTQIPRAPVYNRFIENGQAAIDAIHHNAGPSYSQFQGGRVLYWLADHTPLFRPWIFAVIGLLMFALVRDRVTAGILASGFLYELSFFPFSADPDYRYSHWMVTCVVIATTIIFLKRRGITPEANPEPSPRIKLALTPVRIVVLGWIGFLLLYAWPGYLTVEAADMLLDSRSGELTDWHSPLMAELWRLLGLAIGGPPAMLLLQSGAFVFGAYTLLCRLTTPKRAAITSVCVLAFPPVMATLAVICQDSLVIAALVGAAALFTCERRWLRIAGLVAAMIACGAREGAALAALPIVVGGFVWRSSDRRLVRYGIGIGAWLACVLVSIGLNRFLPATETRTTEAELAAIDIVGTVAKAKPLTDAQIKAVAPAVHWYLPNVPGIQARARAIYGKPHRYAFGDDRVLETWETLDEAEDLIDARRAFIREFPKAYLMSRVMKWVRMLGGRRNAVYAQDVAVALHRETAQHAARPAAFQKLVVKLVQKLGNTPLFAPYIYLALGLLLLPFAIWRKQRDMVLLLLSAVAMWIALVFVTGDNQWRYVSWPVVATVLAATLAITLRRASAAK